METNFQPSDLELCVYPKSEGESTRHVQSAKSDTQSTAVSTTWIPLCLIMGEKAKKYLEKPFWTDIGKK